MNMTKRTDNYYCLQIDYVHEKLIQTSSVNKKSRQQYKRICRICDSKKVQNVKWFNLIYTIV